jgi:hypothetical protein
MAAPLVVLGLKPATGKINTANGTKIWVRFIAVILLNCAVVALPVHGPFICKSHMPSGHSGATPSAINRRLFAALSLSGLIASNAIGTGFTICERYLCCNMYARMNSTHKLMNGIYPKLS